jgi:hypothetical protein
MPFLLAAAGGSIPGTVTGVTASAGNANAVVFFTPPDYLGKGTVTYSVTSNPVTTTIIFSASGETFTGLSNGTSYTFVVRTLTDYSVYSEPSTASSAVTPAAPPPPTPTPAPVPTDPCAGVTCGGSCGNTSGYTFQGLQTVTNNPFGNCGDCASTSYNLYSRTCCDSLACFTQCNSCAPPPCGVTGVPPGNGWTASGGLQFLGFEPGTGCNPRNSSGSVWQLYVAPNCTPYNLFLNCQAAF